MTSVPLFLSSEHPCGYLERQTAQTVSVNPFYKIRLEHYEQLIQEGFRRGGNDVYMPHCPACSACIPARVAVAHFKPSRSQKRCFRKNLATEVVVKPADFNQAHYEMYLRYQAFRHQDGYMALFKRKEYMYFLTSDWCKTFFIEFSINKELAAIAVVDQFENAWSAVYTFYEPKFSSYSPGVYAILWQIEQARLTQKEYLYLGFWIKNCRKMAYKAQYQPLQLFIKGQWIEQSGQCR